MPNKPNHPPSGQAGAPAQTSADGATHSDKKCPNMARCPLFPKFKLDMVLRFWIDTYCETDFAQCARYRSAQANVRPSDTMLPNGKDLYDTTAAPSTFFSGRGKDPKAPR